MRFQARTWLLVTGALALASSLFAADPPPKVSPYLPEDTKTIVILNVDNLIASKQVKEKDLKAIHDEWYRNNFTPALKTDKATSPLRKVRNATAAFPAVGDVRAMIVISGDIDAKLLHQQVAENKSIEQDGKEGETVIYKQKLAKGETVSFGWLFPVEPAETAWFALVDEQTWVLSTRNRDDVARAIRIKAGKDKPALNEPLQKLIDATPIKDDSFSLLLVNHELPEKINDKLPKDLARPFKECQHMVGHVRYGATVTMVLEYTGKTAKDAVDAEKGAKSSLETVKSDYLEPLKPLVLAYDLALATTGKAPEEMKRPAALYHVVSMALATTKIKRTGNVVRIESSVPADKATVLMQEFVPKMKK